VDVVIAGGHGQIARRLTRLLTARGDTVRAIVRHPGHIADVEQDGARGVLLDLEQASVDAVAASVQGSDAVVFAAGAGPGSGIGRKDTVDRAASVLMADASERTGVRRFVQISSMGTDRASSGQPMPGMDDVFAAYLRAKAAAEDDLRRRGGLRWTVLRPGRLVNDPGTGLVTLETQVPRGQVTRDDVAAVVAALLPADETTGMTLELTGGSTPVEEAVRRLVES
jgi:nucleoside-diphosphate-sugar epimerase